MICLLHCASRVVRPSRVSLAPAGLLDSVAAVVGLKESVAGTVPGRRRAVDAARRRVNTKDAGGVIGVV